MYPMFMHIKHYWLSDWICMDTIRIHHSARNRPHRRSSSKQNTWMRRRILPCGSLAFYQASCGLSTHVSRGLSTRHTKSRSNTLYAAPFSILVYSQLLFSLYACTYTRFTYTLSRSRVATRISSDIPRPWGSWRATLNATNNGDYVIPMKRTDAQPIYKVHASWSH